MGIVHGVIVGGSQNVKTKLLGILQNLRRRAEPGAAADGVTVGFMVMDGGFQVKETEIALRDKLLQLFKTGIIAGQPAQNHCVTGGSAFHSCHINNLLSVLSIWDCGCRHNLPK